MRFQKRHANTFNVWEQKEIALLSNLIKQGHTLKDIHKFFPERTSPSLRNKYRRLRFQLGIYNEDHKQLKKNKTEDWLKKTKPKTIFEGFSGKGYLTSLYLKYASELYCCEKNKRRFEILEKNTMNSLVCENPTNEHLDEKTVEITSDKHKVILYHGDCQKLAAKLYSEDKKVDLVDIDPCGTILPSLPLFLRIIDRGAMLITFGDFYSYRFGRKDVLFKNIPLIFDIKTKKVETDFLRSSEDIYNLFIGWTILSGAFSIENGELKCIKKNETILLGKKPGVLRVLFKVRKADSLSQILNNATHFFNKIDN